MPFTDQNSSSSNFTGRMGIILTVEPIGKNKNNKNNNNNRNNCNNSNSGQLKQCDFMEIMEIPTIMETIGLI